MCSARSTRSSCAERLRRLAALAFALWIAAPALAAAGEGVDVVATTAAEVSVEPGRIVPIAFRVTSERAAAVHEGLVLPEGWRTLLPTAPFRLEAGAPAVRTLAVAVPAGTPAGTYAIRYGVIGVDDPALRDEGRVIVSVAAVAGLSLAVEGASPIVLAGEAWEADLRVTNDGNAPATVAIRVLGDADVDVEDAAFAVDLPPRTDTVVPLRVATRADEPRATEHVLRIEARTTAGPSAVAGAVVKIPVVPRHRRSDLGRELPATARLSVTEGDGRVGAQAEIAARGAVDPDGDVQVDLLLRAPDSAYTGLFSRREELRLDVITEHADLHLGDRAWEVSPLLSAGRYARGVGVDARAGDLAIGAHHARPREGWSGEPETAVRARLDVGEGAWVAVHALDRPEQDVRSLASAAAGVGDERNGVAAELASAPEGGPEHQAWRVDARGALDDRTSVTVRHATAGADFPGYVRDASITSAAGALALSPTWTAEAGVHRVHENLLLRDGPATASLRGSVDVRAALADHWTVELGAAASRQRDRLDAGEGLDERAVELIASHGAASWDLQAQLAAGTSTRDGITVPVARGIARAMLHPTGRHAFGVEVSSRAGGHDATSLFVAQDAAGFAVELPIGQRLALDANASLGLGDGASDRVNASLVRTWRDGTTLTARFAANRNTLGASHSGLLELALPFGVPLGRDATAAALRGRITDASGAPLAGVRVTAGGALAVTGADGEYLLAGLAPGAVHVQVDPRTLGPGRVTTDVLPKAVELGAGDEARLDLVVVDAARLSGRVVRVERGSAGPTAVVGDGTRDPVGFAGLRVEITDGAERFVRRTDERGAFRFDGLRPGTWRVTIRPEGLPAHHRLEQPEQRLLLAAGEDGAIEVRVVPEARPIRMVDGGALPVMDADAPREAAEVVELRAPARVQVLVGGSREIGLAARLSNGVVLDVAREARCSASGEAVSVVGARVTGRRPGAAEVACRWGGRAVAVAVEVVDAPPVALYAEPRRIVVDVGTVATPSVTALLVDGRRLEAGSIAQLSSSDARVVEVEEGRLRAVGPGTARIRVVWNGVAALPVEVEVVAEAPVALRGPDGPIAARVGDRSGLDVSAVWADGREEDASAVITWRSSAPGVADVVDGELVAAGEGRASLVATWGDLASAPVEVEVRPALRPRALVIGPALGTVRRWRRAELRAVAVWDDGTREDVTGRVRWGLDDPGLASVADGSLLALRAGHTEVWAELDGLRARPLSLEVVDDEVVGIVLDHAEIGLVEGEVASVRATVVFADGRSADVTRRASWRVDGLQIVEPRADGTIVGLAAGEATLVATWAGVESLPVAVRVREAR